MIRTYTGRVRAIDLDMAILTMRPLDQVSGIESVYLYISSNNPQKHELLSSAKSAFETERHITATYREHGELIGISVLC